MGRLEASLRDGPAALCVSIVHYALRSLLVTGKQPQQKTRPKKGEPVEIPVPKKRDVMGVLRRAALRRTSTSK